MKKAKTFQEFSTEKKRSQQEQNIEDCLVKALGHHRAGNFSSAIGQLALAIQLVTHEVSESR